MTVRHSRLYRFAVRACSFELGVKPFACCMVMAFIGCSTTPPLVRTPSPLHVASADGNTTRTVQLLNVIDPNVRYLSHNVSMVDWQANSTPLHWAATNGSRGSIEALLNAGAEIEAQGALGWTPLHCAAFAGQGATCELLVLLGARVDSRTERGETPLHLAAWSGGPKTIARLISLGADVNETTNFGKTPLHMAASAGHPKTAERLLSLGANLDAVTSTGEKAIDLARMHRHQLTAKALSRD